MDIGIVVLISGLAVQVTNSSPFSYDGEHGGPASAGFVTVITSLLFLCCCAGCIASCVTARKNNHGTNMSIHHHRRHHILTKYIPHLEVQWL